MLDTGAAVLTASPSPDSRRSWVTSAPRCATCPRQGSSPSASWRPRTSRRWTWVVFQVCAWLLAAIGGHLRAGRGPEPSTWTAGLRHAGHTGCLSGFGSSGQDGAGAPLRAAFPLLSLWALEGRGQGRHPHVRQGQGRAGGGRARPDAGPPSAPGTFYRGRWGRLCLGRGSGRGWGVTAPPS